MTDDEKKPIPTLFDDDDFDHRKFRRNTDPETSDAAARTIKVLRGKQHMEILRVMREAGEPLASEQIKAKLGYDIWKRMSELRVNLYIRKAMVPDHHNKSGRAAQKFELIPR